MGFGLLLVGYFTATMMSLNSLGGVFRLIGYILVIIAAKKLSDYNRSFLFLLGGSVIMTAFSAVGALSDVSAFLYNNLLISAPIVSTAVSDMLPSIRLFLDLAFTAVLCFSIRSIAKETGEEKIVYTSVRNFIFFCIFFVLQFLVWLGAQISSPAFTDFVRSTALPVWTVLVYLICVIFNCVMIFSCYAKICDANDLEMRVKPSRFAFVNRMREKRESKSEAYIEEAQRYSEEQTQRSAATARAKKKNTVAYDSRSLCFYFQSKHKHNRSSPRLFRVYTYLPVAQ